MRMPSSPRFADCSDATPADALAVAAVRNAAADRLTAKYGSGHWSSLATERAVLRGMEHARLLVARDGNRIVGTLRLATKKPWAIDPSFFTALPRPLYLMDMAVEPDRQRSGVGRGLMEYAVTVARAWPAQSIRLDAYDAAAGAGGFYAKCGFREVGRVVYRKTPLVYFEKLIDD